MGETVRASCSMPEWMLRELLLHTVDAGERSERMRTLMMDGRAVERALFERAMHFDDPERRREFVHEAISNEVDRRDGELE